MNSHACRFSGNAQRRDNFAIVDLMVLRTENGAGDLSGQMRLARPRCRGRQPFQRQAELILKIQAVRSFGLIVGGQRQSQRAFLAQFDINAARPQKLAGKTRPARLAVAAKREQRLFAGLGFATRRQHAGRGMARARADLAAIEHRDRRTGGEPPSDAKADHTGADDGDVRLFADMGKLGRQRRLPSLE